MSGNQQVLQVLDCISLFCNQTRCGYRPLSEYESEFSKWKKSGFMPVIWNDKICVVERDAYQKEIRKLYPAICYKDGTIRAWTDVLGLKDVEVWFVREPGVDGDCYVEIRFLDCDQSVVIQDGIWVLC